MTSAHPRTPADGPESLRFDHLDIQWDRRVPEPERWTAEASHLAAAVAPECSPGPILELCNGVGQIGLLTASLTGRDLVQVESDPVAADWARRNAAAARVASDVRTGSFDDALRDGERFPLAIADPPWVPRTGDAVLREDPAHVGPDATPTIGRWLDAALRHLTPAGWCVLPVRTRDEARTAGAIVVNSSEITGVHRVVDEVRDCLPGGLLVLIGPAAGEPDPNAGGTLSEAYRGAGQPVFPADATAGYPVPDEDVQEGTAGPNARPRENSPERRGDENTR